MRYLLLALVCALSGCRTAPDPPPGKSLETASMAVESPAVTIADTATVELPLTLPAQLYVEHDATVYSRSTGIVQSIRVDLGSRVSAGQLLAQLESTDQEITLARAREKVTSTSQTRERQLELSAAAAGTEADSERVELEYRQAVLDLRKAQRDYDLTRILAPFAGVVTVRTARLHRLVNAGDSLFRITALQPVLAAIHVPESSAGMIDVGTRAEVLGPSGIRTVAKVIRASPVLDAGSGTREVILQLTGKERLTPGSNVTVRLGSQRRQVVAIPRSAVAQDGYALVWSDDKATMRPITVGGDVGEDRIEVISGLTPGEKILRTVP